MFDEQDGNILVMIYYVEAPADQTFINQATLSFLRAKGVKVVAIWGDVQNPVERRILRRIRKSVDLNVCTASYAVASRLSRKMPVLYAWPPISDERLEPCDCGAYVSYAGSPKRDRIETIRFLEANGIQVHSSKGSLSRPEYLRILAHPVTLSFNRSGFESVSNARLFESLRQGACVLEEESRETRRFLEPGAEYVSWTNNLDLLSRTQELMLAPEIAEAIAQRGYEKSLAWTNDKLWRDVLYLLNSDSSARKHAVANWLRPKDQYRSGSDIRGWLLQRGRLEGIIFFGQLASIRYRDLLYRIKRRVRLP
jgi:hypothetical protein